MSDSSVVTGWISAVSGTVGAGAAVWAARSASKSKEKKSARSHRPWQEKGASISITPTVLKKNVDTATTRTSLLAQQRLAELVRVFKKTSEDVVVHLAV
jgi:hypothetical protein